MTDQQTWFLCIGFLIVGLVFGMNIGVEIERARNRADYVYLIGVKERESKEQEKRVTD